MYKKEECFSFDKDVFMNYFHKNNWTLDIYEDYVRKSLHQYSDFRKNQVYPNGKRLRRLLTLGYIPLKETIQLCQLFNCKPEQIGIDAHYTHWSE